MRALALLILLLATALLATACLGPKNPDQSLADACARQLEEVKSEAGSTPTAKSTDEALAKVTLHECAGQKPAKAAATTGTGAGADGATDGAPTKVALDPAARALFSSSCGGCHALSDAKTAGAVGPNLDETKLDAAAIAAQIKNGGGAMPPNLLAGEDAEKVAGYVAAAAAAA